MSKEHLSEYIKDKQKYKFNRHHIIWVTNRDLFNVYLPANIIEVPVLKHRALNTLIWEKQTPRWLFETAHEWTYPVLSEYAETLLRTLIEMPDDQLYKKEFIKKGVEKYKQHNT